MKIDTICNSLLETLIQAGYNENTIFNYRGVIRRFKAFCKEKEAFEYTPELGQSYADDVISKKTGKFSKQRYFSQGRFARLLTSYYYTGSFDLSVMKRRRKEPENQNLNKLYYEYDSYLREKYSNENTVRFYDYEVFCFFSVSGFHPDIRTEGNLGCYYRGLSQNDETEQAARSPLWAQTLFYFHRTYRSFCGHRWHARLQVQKDHPCVD